MPSPVSTDSPNNAGKPLMRAASVTLHALIGALYLVPVAPANPAEGAGPAVPEASDPPAARQLDPAAVEFFEKKIRPVLTQHCYACHSMEAEKNKKLKGGLYLDSAAALLKGGDSGPVLVPGKPAESLLLKTLKYDGDTQMPPK